MTKSKASEPVPEPQKEELSGVDSETDVDEQVDSSPQVKSAADAVRRAEAELKKARDFYEKVRGDATEQLRKVREATVGDVIDGTLKTVQRHPGPSMLLALAIGFFFGRLFRR